MSLSLEQQVCSLELAKKLKELGVKQESFFDWECRMGNWSLIWGDYHVHPYIDTADVRQYVSAFTVAEIGEMLPDMVDGNGWLQCDKIDKRFYVHYSDDRGYNILEVADTEADARAKMLVYLLENKLITL